MNKTTKVLAVAAAIAFCATYGVAYAADLGPEQGVVGHPGPSRMGGHGSGTSEHGDRPFSGMSGHGSGEGSTTGMMHGPGDHSSTTWQRGMGSTTWNGGDGGKHGSTTPMTRPGIHGIPGTVSVLGTNQFTLTFPGKDSTTNTFTITIADSTKFMHGSTTGSFSDLTVGTKVLVQGKINTATKTIAAERVLFGMGDGGSMGTHDGGHEGSTSDQNGSHNGFLNKLKNMFGGSHGDSQTSGGAAAAEGNDFLGSLFGWMH